MLAGIDRKPPRSLSSAGSIGIWRGGIRPAARGVGIYGGGRWWVAPESSDGLRAKAGVQSRRNAGRTATRRSPPDLSLPRPPRFSIGLLRRNRDLASPADDSDRHRSVPPGRPSGLSAIDRDHLRSGPPAKTCERFHSSAPSLCRARGCEARLAFQTCKRVAATCN